MGRKLYVGNLSYQTGEDELKLAFAQCGKVVEAKVIIDRESGRSRGFGFVTMSTDEEAAEAVRVWSGANLAGRSLTVNEAQDKDRGAAARPRQPGGGGYNANGGYSTDSSGGGGGGGGDGGGKDRGRRSGRGGGDRGRGRDRDWG